MSPPASLADLIDASSWSPSSTSYANGVNAGGYTTVVSFTYQAGVAGKGATIKPNGGDTTKTLFLPNSGFRYDTDGAAQVYGTTGYLWSIEQSPRYTSQAWFLEFASGSASYGSIGQNMNKLTAKPLRCVRS